MISWPVLSVVLGLLACQNDPGDPSNPIGPILRRQRCDPNGVWFIFVAWGVSAILIYLACGRIHNGRWYGWLLLSIGVALGLAFGLSGMFGCLPWYWGRCEDECKGCQNIALVGHPTATKLYVWSHATDDPDNPKRHVTVLHYRGVQ